MKPSLAMLERLSAISRAGPDGCKSWHGRTNDALLRRGLIRFEPAPGKVAHALFFVTEMGRAALQPADSGTAATNGGERE